MKKFSWANFSAVFMNSVLSSKITPVIMRPSHQTDDPVMLTPYMEDIASEPSRYFVEKYREEIERHLLKEDQKLLAIAYTHCTGQKELPRYAFEELCRKPFSQNLAGAYRKVLLIVGGAINEDEFITRFGVRVSIDLKNTAIPENNLYKYQNSAVSALEKHFIKEDKDSGLLVMPTGSGKTRTVIYFLLKKMVSEGYKIVWLTHRHMLIEQPAEALWNYSGLVKAQNPKKRELRFLCVSGSHASIRQAEARDDILILTVQSAVRSLPYLKRVLKGKVMIVVDEAHHTVAASYRKTIESIKAKSKVKLLGLTATPVRINEKGTAHLTKLYDDTIIYSIDTATLITQGFLAEPVFEQVDTDFEILATINEKKYIEKYGELDPALVDKIARSGERNNVIVNRYMEGRERYGKTLLFALNIYHCLTLCDDFKAQGVRCDYVYSGRADNATVIDRFRRGELDVLININILTEGSDVPDIQTVFLTRPTASEALLMQMIGRGMRGVGTGGTEQAYIVDFNDKWDTFVKWLTPKFVLAGEYSEISEEKQCEPMLMELIPFRLISDVYKYITYDYTGQPTYNMIMPSGWYSAVDDEGNDIIVLVSEDQLEGYSALMRDKEKLLGASTLTGADLQKYFVGFASPPPVDHMQAYLNDLRIDEHGVPPHIYPFSGRKAFDPVTLSQRFKNEDFSYTQMQETMEKAYAENPLAQKTFDTLDSYKQRVMTCLAGNEKPIGGKVEELPLESIPFDLTPHHDLEKLSREVLYEMFGECDGISSVSWTDKYYKWYYGKYFPTSNEIRINKILNSKDVPPEVIKFLLYHELLHRDYPGHGKAFRERENMYPGCVKWNCFLDGQMSKFNLGDVWK